MEIAMDLALLKSDLAAIEHLIGEMTPTEAGDGVAAQFLPVWRERLGRLKTLYDILALLSTLNGVAAPINTAEGLKERLAIWIAVARKIANQTANTVDDKLVTLAEAILQNEQAIQILIVLVEFLQSRLLGANGLEIEPEGLSYAALSEYVRTAPLAS